MSGGAYDYLYLKLEFKLDELSSALSEEVIEDIEKVAKTHPYFRTVLGKLNSYKSRIDALKEETHILKILKEIEWWASGDISIDTCEDRVREIVRETYTK